MESWVLDIALAPMSRNYAIFGNTKILQTELKVEEKEDGIGSVICNCYVDDQFCGTGVAAGENGKLYVAHSSADKTVAQKFVDPNSAYFYDKKSRVCITKDKEVVVMNGNSMAIYANVRGQSIMLKIDVELPVLEMLRLVSQSIALGYYITKTSK